MESIREIFKIGFGPSSSHTMGPRKASEIFLSENPEFDKLNITLYGSLAATGKGHLTDIALYDVFKNRNIELIWKPEIFLEKHPNGLKFEAFNSKGELIKEKLVYSIGGGSILDENSNLEKKSIYELNKMNDILNYINKNGKTFWEYVDENEESDIWDHLNEVWNVMQNAVKRGIDEEGRLPGPLNLQRKAHTYFIKAEGLKDSLRSRSLVFSYALAVSEENAAGGKVVTAPTCGSCGVLPAVLYHIKNGYNFSDKKILRAIATAGLIGNLVKFNASISGAEVGCKGEIGTACAMASGAVLQLFGGSPYQIEYAAEMGLEHHLGLTCDPVAGLVQVPCIERNAFAAARALDANTFALLSDGKHRISFDKVVLAMKQTGHDIPHIYRETSEGGLAILY